MAVQHVVVDGSNIATEGRTAPSLTQLDEAVRAFLEEFGDVKLTVVVDATFGHRIDDSERDEFEAGIVNGELVSPPAGAIGRGDAFILQVADKADAAVFSNDSFQEFHGIYDWLFDEGRLVGGKPVPAVGWVFVMRTPVRGPTSRRATRSKPKKSAPSSSGIELGPVPVPTRPPPRGRGEKSEDDDAAVDAKPAKAAKKARKSTKKAAGKSAEDAPASSDGGDRPAKRGGGRRGGPKDDGAKDASDAPSSGGRSRRRRSSSSSGGNGKGDPINEPMPFLEFVTDHPVGSEVEATVDRFSSHGAYAVTDGGAQCYISLKAMADPPPTKARDLVSLGDVRTFVVTAFDSPRRSIDVGFPGVVEPEEPSADSATDRHDDGLPTGAHEPAEEAPTMAAKKTAPAKKSTAKKSTAKKSTAKKTTAAKAPAKKAPAKATTKDSVTKAPAKSAAKKAQTKAPAKKAAEKKTPAKAVAKKAPAKASAKKAPAKKATTAKAAANEAPASKTAAAKAPARKAPAKSVAKKAPAKASAKKAPAKKSTAKKSTAKKAVARKTTSR